MRVVKLVAVIITSSLLWWGCANDPNKLFNEYKEVKQDGWNWTDAKTFQFEIPEDNYLYHLGVGLRITGSYKYSNIWLVYVLEGPKGPVKKQFQILLSDNTGKWLGEGMSNLISFEKPFLQNVKLAKGKYTIRFMQNMRDEKLEGVSDIGLLVQKGQKVY